MFHVNVYMIHTSYLPLNFRLGHRPHRVPRARLRPASTETVRGHSGARAIRTACHDCTLYDVLFFSKKKGRRARKFEKKLKQVVACCCADLYIFPSGYVVCSFFEESQAPEQTDRQTDAFAETQIWKTKCVGVDVRWSKCKVARLAQPFRELREPEL
jgi:hypothetical protein